MNRNYSLPRKRAASLQPDASKYSPYCDKSASGKSPLSRVGMCGFFRDRLAVVGASGLFVALLFAVFGRLLNVESAVIVASALGTSLVTSLCAAAIAFAFGLFYGLLSTCVGERAGVAMEVVARFFYRLPDVPAALMILAVLDQFDFGAALGTNTAALFAAFIPLYWSGIAILARSRGLTERDDDYARAAKELKVKKSATIRNRTRPNTVRVLCFSGLLLVPSALVLETVASLSGLCAGSPCVTLGVLANAGLSAFPSQPLLLIVPLLTAAFAAISLYIVGSRLRLAFSPQTSA